jgi:hypothetical protein
MALALFGVAKATKQAGANIPSTADELSELSIVYLLGDLWFGFVIIF